MRDIAAAGPRNDRQLGKHYLSDRNMQKRIILRRFSRKTIQVSDAGIFDNPLQRESGDWTS